MSKVLSYISSSIWAMREREFSSMLAIAARNHEALEKITLEFDGKSKPEAMTSKKGERLMNTSYVEVREGNIAVIDVNGRLAKRMDFFTEVCEGGTSTEKLLKDFQTCLENPNISSIVLHIDSPGGEAFGINEIASHITAAKGKKPIKAYVSGLGCSGAYWIASAADEIICDKSAFLGSIGVVSVWMDDTEFYKMLGIDKKVITSSNAPKKRLDLNTAEGSAEFQAELDAIEKVFISAVGKNRDKKFAEVVNDFNQGGVLCGADAVKVGMADRIGSLEGVIAELKKSAKNTKFGAEKTGEFDMSFKDSFKNFAAAVGFNVTETETPIEAETETPIAVETSVNQTATETPTAPDLEAEKARLATEREQLFVKQAKVFADGEVSANRLLPAERDSVEAAYLQALKDDEASPLSTGSRAELVASSVNSRQPHYFTQERISPDVNGKILKGDLSDEEKLDAQIEAQTTQYVSTVTPKTNLTVVK